MSNKGKIIVIDGLDGSGKSTQAPLLLEYLKSKGLKVKLISFPDYNEPSSALVKMYLNGEFSDNAQEVNAYAASSFYAVDRYASFKKFWEQYYNDGYIIVATRYVTSNAIHQMSKLDSKDWDYYINWLEDYEYEKLGLPKPDKVIFLSMSREVSQKLLSGRYEGDESKKDIHEKNIKYFDECIKTSKYAAQKMNWDVVSCCDGENPYSVEQIASKIQKCVDDIL